jgi:hypothetical protein
MNRRKTIPEWAIEVTVGNSYSSQKHHSKSQSVARRVVGYQGVIVGQAFIDPNEARFYVGNFCLVAC